MEIRRKRRIAGNHTMYRWRFGLVDLVRMYLHGGVSIVVMHNSDGDDGLSVYFGDWIPPDKGGVHVEDDMP